MKKVISFILCLCLACSLGTAAFASGEAPEGEKRAVIGADLTADQIASVYEMFGVERGSVPELTVTNSEERDYLSGLVDDSVIGTKSISCVYIEILGEDAGLQIETDNLSWCTKEMYINALVTAGIDNAKIIVAAPFEVSGTAALTGIFKAYEDITGQPIDETAKVAGTQELVVTSELADEIGSYDSVSIVNDLKLILDQTKQMTDDELRAKITEIAKGYNVTLTDSQMEQLVSLCRQLEKMNSDELKAKVESVQQTIKKMAAAQEKVSGIAATVQNIVQSIADFFNSIISVFKG